MHKAVVALTRPSKTGCRVVADGPSSVQVYDLQQWSHEQSDVLRSLHPRIELSVQGSAQSLSGFVLQIREPPPSQYLPLRLLLAAGLLLLGLSIGPFLGMLTDPLPLL
jgi:hypothetical protein